MCSETSLVPQQTPFFVADIKVNLSTLITIKESALLFGLSYHHVIFLIHLSQEPLFGTT